uniref:Uncharacterized protein n=1 Tax=Arundo donax TaxID=35708 RepID=A0A0A8YDS2_ARUDO
MVLCFLSSWYTLLENIILFTYMSK